MEHRQKILAIFYDLTNAFGTVCVPILLRKFELNGVRGVALDWLRSSLTGRTQVVKMTQRVGKWERTVFSSEVSVVRGTPQGGVLSPSLFVGGVCDMLLYVLIGFTVNYADDTSSLLSAPTNEELYQNARLSAEMLQEFCEANFLTLNASKSVLVQFRGQKQNVSPQIDLAGQLIQCADHAKFLGLHVRQDCKWDDHAQYVSGRLHTTVTMLNGLKGNVDEKSLLNVYYAHANSIMSYGIVIWGASDGALRTVFVAQKRLIRALAGERYWKGLTPLCSARPLFERYNLLPVFSIYLFEACKFVKKYPAYFKKTRDVHGHGTRRAPELYIAPQKLLISQQNPFSSAAMLYNALPVSLRHEPRYEKFVVALNEFLHLKKFYDSVAFLEFIKNL